MVPAQITTKRNLKMYASKPIVTAISQGRVDTQAGGRLTEKENRESLLGYFKSRRPYRIALGQTDFPEPLGNRKGYRDGQDFKPRVRRMTNLKPCGTEAAYQRHLLYKEPVDDACKEEHSRYRRAGRDREKAKAQS